MVHTAWALLWWVAAAASELTAQASSSARPKPCRADAARGGAPTAWDAGRRHATDQRCAQLARAQTLLATAPDAALTLARELAPAWPDSPEPLVLEARALTKLEKYREAWPVWQAARERGHDLGAPRALRDYAATAAAVGQHEAALTAYRRLMALRALWPDARDRQALALEAAAAALRHHPPRCLRRAARVATR
jgi:tetratricopeptide (TPR) repeat protein